MTREQLFEYEIKDLIEHYTEKEEQERRFLRECKSTSQRKEIEHMLIQYHDVVIHLTKILHKAGKPENG